MAKFFICIFSILLSVPLFSQGKYGQDSEACIKYLSFYKEYYKQKNQDAAYSYWKKAFKTCPPSASQTMLVDGTFLLRNEIKETKIKRKKEKLINQLLSIHDIRAQYFPKYSITALNNKSLDAINYITDYKQLYDTLQPIILTNKTDVKPVALLAYLSAAINLFHNNCMSRTEINSIICTVNELIISIHPKTEEEFNSIISIRHDIETLTNNL